MVHFVELSHRIRSGMQTYPGLPVPATRLLLDYDESRDHYEGRAEFRIGAYELCGNTGTYVDAPAHRHRGAADLADLPLERLAHLPIAVVDVADAVAAGGLAIGAEALPSLDVGGRAVLVRTGWSSRWGTGAYFDPNPHLTREACEVLVEGGAAFVGIDAVNIDSMADASRPAHTVLLGAGIPVCEHMTNLQVLNPGEGRLHAVPLAWEEGVTFPVRAYAVIE